MAFSIRDYTNKMRTINAFECWPFPDMEELKQDKIISMLPPMVVPKRSRSRRRRSRDARKLNRSAICSTDVGGTSASRENLSIRSNSRPRKIDDIFYRKMGNGNCLSIPTPPQMLAPLPPPPPPPPIPTYPSMPPPPPRPKKNQLFSPSLSQIENMLNIIVLDDEEDEDPQMVSKFRKGKKRLNVERLKSNVGFLALDEEKEESKINSLALDVETTEESRLKFPMKRSSKQNFMVASNINFAVSREHNIKIEKEDKVEAKGEELAASKAILSPNAHIIGKSRFFPKKDKRGVRNNNMELNFNGMPNIKMNQADKLSKIGSSSGLSVNNISNQSSQENVVVVKQELFDPIDSEWKHVRGPFIERNKQDNVAPMESSHVISSCSGLPIMSLNGIDVSIGRSNQVKQKKPIVVRDFPVRGESKRRHYYEDGAKLEPYSSSQLQISSEMAFQPRNLPSNPSLQRNLLMKNPNVAFLQNNHVSPNQSIDDRRNASSNFPEKFRVGTNPQGLVFQHSLSNAEINDRKRGYHDACSPLRLQFSSQPSTQLSSSTSTRERLLRPTSSNIFPQNTWNLNFTKPFPNHPTNAMYSPNSGRNSNVCHVPIIQPIPIVNQPSAIKSSHHTFTNSRKRRAVEIIDFTNPHKVPNVGASSESNTQETKIGTSDVARSRSGVDLNDQNSEKDHIN